MPYRRTKSLWRSIRIYIHLAFRRLRIPSARFLDLIAIVVGYLTALLGYCFLIGVEWVSGVSQTIVNASSSPYIIVLIPAVGGLICGLILHFLAMGQKGIGVPEVIHAVLMKSGILKARSLFAKYSATTVTVGSFGSAGTEGPIIHMGSILGSWMGQLLNLSPQSRKTLVGCGAAAGLSAMFNAPIGGVLFSLEVILGTFSPGVFTPIILASVVSSVTFHSILEAHNAFLFNIHYVEQVWEVLCFVLVGGVCGVLSVLFIRVLSLSSKVFGMISLPYVIKPAIGGLLVGFFLLYSQDLAGGSYPIIESLVKGESMTIKVLLLLLLLKMMATCLTVGSGGCGGVFSPSLAMGAFVGAAIHQVLSPMIPEISSVGIYIMVGMGSFVAGTIHGPIGAILILCEMTGNYSAILPLLAGCVVSTIVARSLFEYSIYTNKLVEMGIYLKDGYDLDVLKTYHVEDLMETDILCVPFDMHVREILPLLHDSPHEHVLVRDEDDRIEGVISYYDLTPFILKKDKGLDRIAREAMHETHHYVYASDPVIKAYDKFLMKESSYLLVLDEQHVYTGIVFKSDIMRSYRKALHQKSLAMTH